MPGAIHRRLSFIRHGACNRFLLGWSKPGVASLELDFDEPDAARASALVQQMAALPRLESFKWNGPTPPYRDFWTLSYPVYLAPLAALATPEALEGIGQTPGDAAVRTLVELSSRPELRLSVARELSQRPAAEGTRARALARALARKLLSGDDEICAFGAAILEKAGDPEDLPAALTALDAHLPASLGYPRPAGPQYSLERAALALSRGRTPEAPHTSAERLVALSAPHPSPALAREALSDRSARVRELAVAAAPAEALSDALLRDPDVGVRCAACARLLDHRALLAVLWETDNEWLLRAAVASAPGLRVDCVSILAHRLPERARWQTVLSLLLDVTMRRVPGSSSNGDPSPAELLRLRGAWLAFLAKHRAEMASGKRYATVPPALLPSNFTLDLPG